MSIPYTYKNPDGRQRLVCREMAVSGAQGKGNEGRGYGLRSAVHVIKAITPSCRRVGTPDGHMPICIGFLLMEKLLLH